MSMGAIDAWATHLSPENAKKWPAEFRHIFRKYGVGERFEKGMSLEEMLAEMDEAGVDICIASSFVYKGEVIVTHEEVLECARKYPKRFFPCCTVDPRDTMAAVRQLESYVKEGFIALRLEPYQYGDGMRALPPNDKLYYPLYAKCCELGIPVCIQVGHTGPLLPSECGRPIYLDEVALTFPELTILGCHLGQPWHEEMMILAWKHENVYVETSARAPKYWPKEFVRFCKTFGQDKVIFATDYPLLGFKRCIEELKGLNLGEKQEQKILRENAVRAFRLEGRLS